MSYEPDSSLIDWQETRSRFGDCCASEGAAQVTSYAIGRAQAERRNEWRCPWLVVAIVVGAVAAALLSVAFPMGFAPLLP